MPRGHPERSWQGRALEILLGSVPALAGLGSCAAPGSDIHLAPFYTRISTADAGIEYEAAGGLWRSRRRALDKSLEEVTVGPFYGRHNEENGDWTANFLVPFGYTRIKGQEGRSYFFFVYHWERRVEADGSTTNQWVSLPLVMYHSNDVKGTFWGWFPVFGDFKDLVTFDRLTWAAFPLFLYCDRAGTVSWNVPWPFLSWHKGVSHGFAVWPLYGQTKKEGRYERFYFLWPFFHYQRNHLGGGNEEPETAWMAWPLLGHKRRGTYRAWSTLWPLFGYAYDPRGDGFWALDFPWFLVRFQRGPGEVSRSRIWPFFGYLHTEDLTSWTFLWPFIHLRREETEEISRKSFYVVPFWQQWDSTYKVSGSTETWRKLWPLFQYERLDERQQGMFPQLNPFWRSLVLDRFIAWTWTLYEWEKQGEMYRSRTWLGLYRREKGLEEDRRSLSGLWARRRYADPSGRRVKETSLLFGLLRWRVTEGEGLDMLRPAFPGPGWPARGAPTDG